MKAEDKLWEDLIQEASPLPVFLASVPLHGVTPATVAWARLAMKIRLAVKKDRC